jgi:hypothetical protein
MPSNMKHESTVKSPTAKQAQRSVPTSGRKAPGTRIGLYIDWRGSATSGRLSDRYGRSLRDGR